MILADTKSCRDTSSLLKTHLLKMHTVAPSNESYASDRLQMLDLVVIKISFPHVMMSGRRRCVKVETRPDVL